MKKVIWTLMSIILLTSCGNSKSETKLRSVKTTVAKIENYDSNNSFPFISKPFRNSQLSFRVNGLLNNFQTISGEYYSKGAVVAQLDTRDFAIHKERMQATFKQAEAEYKRIKALYELNNIAQVHMKKQKTTTYLPKQPLK